MTPTPPSSFASLSPLPEDDRMPTWNPSSANFFAAAAPSHSRRQCGFVLCHGSVRQVARAVKRHILLHASIHWADARTSPSRGRIGTRRGRRPEFHARREGRRAASGHRRCLVIRTVTVPSLSLGRVERQRGEGGSGASVNIRQVPARMSARCIPRFHRLQLRKRHRAPFPSPLVPRDPPKGG